MQVEPAAVALGAYVSGVSVADVGNNPALQQELRELVVAHQVVFLRDQAVNPAQFQEFALSFGPSLQHGAYQAVEGAPEVHVLESTADKPSKIELWHSDMTFAPQPPSFTVLHGQIIPDVGGDTMWASAAAAWDNLSASFQELFAPLTALHDFRFGFRESLAEPGGLERLAPMIAANPPVEHPVVRTHPENGRKALYVNPLFTKHLQGVTRHESEHLLAFLYEHIVREEHTVRLRWEPNTIAIWDNRSTQHKPINDFFPAHRKLHRLTIAGDTPA